MVVRVARTLCDKVSKKTNVSNLGFRWRQPLSSTAKYVELPFKTERLRVAPLCAYRRILNAIEV